MSDVEAKDANGVVTAALRGQTATITAGTSGAGGSLTLSDASGKRAVVVTTGASPRPPARTPWSAGGVSVGPAGPVASSLSWKAPPEKLTLDGEHGSIVVGSDHAAGTCIVTSSDGDPTVQLHGADGTITLTDGKGRPSITLDGSKAEVSIGRTDNGGRVLVHNKSGEPMIALDGNTGDVAIGQKGNGGRVFLHDKTGATTVTLDGTKGDIVLANADCAEEFDVAAAADGGLEPGTVVVLDEDGAVRACADDYDGRVAGVVSGAGRFRPALVLDRRAGASPRVPVALIGKVYCLVDADAAPIRAGDLLTTSATPGHARRATDRERAFGAVLGKALGGLAGGRGLVPILVTLQ